MLRWGCDVANRTKGGRRRAYPCPTMGEQKKSTTLRWCFFATRVYKPGSVLTAIYLAPQLLAGSSRLLGTVGQTMRSSTALLRDRVYIVKPMLPWAGQAMNLPFHLSCKCSSISLLHLSWDHSRRALPVIPALWSPDFPHPRPFGLRPRLSNLVAEILYSKRAELSNVLQILFEKDILFILYNRRGRPPGRSAMYGTGRRGRRPLRNGKPTGNEE